jgi:hypothetical protein
MSRSKLIVAYVCLVGIPLAAVVAILWLGRQLVAPLSVAGSWKVEADFSALGSDPCMAPLTAFRQPFLDVSQSGGDLTVRLGNPQKTILPGIVRGRKLRIGAASAEARDCRDPLSLELQATVDGSADRRILSGTLGIVGCTICTAVPFRAVRGNR